MTENTIVLSADDKTAAALIVTIKAAVNGDGKYAAYVAAHGVTKDTVKDHALALAILAYPNEAPVQRKNGNRTKFGNAVQKAGNGLRYALEDDEPETKAPVLRVSLSGEGGGTTIVSADHPLHDALVEMLGASQS